MVFLCITVQLWRARSPTVYCYYLSMGQISTVSFTVAHHLCIRPPLRGWLTLYACFCSGMLRLTSGRSTISLPSSQPLSMVTQAACNLCWRKPKVQAKEVWEKIWNLSSCKMLHYIDNQSDTLASLSRGVSIMREHTSIQTASTLAVSALVNSLSKWSKLSHMAHYPHKSPESYQT